MDGLLDTNWDAPFDFDSFINFPPEADMQGGVEGIACPGSNAILERTPATTFSTNSRSDVGRNFGEDTGHDLFYRLSDLHHREENSVSMANLSGNTGYLAEPQKFDPQGQSLDRIDNSSLVDGGRSLLPTTHATSINESTVREDAFPSFGIQRPSTTSPDDVLSSRVRMCSCFACLGLFKTLQPKDAFPLARRDGEDIHCRIPGCDWKSKVTNSFTHDFHSRIDHEKHHFMKPRPNLSLACTQDHCTFITKREPDLRRHYRSMHCLNPEIFSCPVPWCKYSGVNGFARKDKLTSHYRNVHEGKIGRGQALRHIQPAPSATSASEGRASVNI